MSKLNDLGINEWQILDGVFALKKKEIFLDFIMAI
jgi:hypothetical protein